MHSSEQFSEGRKVLEIICANQDWFQAGSKIYRFVERETFQINDGFKEESGSMIV